MAFCVYFIAELAGDGRPAFVKIGYTQRTQVWARLQTLQTGNPRKLDILLHVPGGPLEEHYLHSFFRAFKVRGEWFRPEERLMNFIQHCSERRKLDLVHLAPCSWKESDGYLERKAPPCSRCDQCNRPLTKAQEDVLRELDERLAAGAPAMAKG